MTLSSEVLMNAVHISALLYPVFIATEKRCLKIKTIKNINASNYFQTKKWFDKECRWKRHELRKLANQKHRDLLNVILREEYHTVLKQFMN